MVGLTFDAAVARGLLLGDFAFTHDLPGGDVDRMLELGIVEVCSAMSGDIVLWCEGLTPEEGKAAYRAVRRVNNRRVVPLWEDAAYGNEARKVV